MCKIFGKFGETEFYWNFWYLKQGNTSASCGYWKIEILVPWKLEVAVEDDGSLSMLSMAATVNKPFLKLGWQTITSFLYLEHSWLVMLS